MKKELLIIPAVALAAWLAIAQDKPAKPDVFDAVAAKPPVAPAAGPFQFHTLGKSAIIFEPSTGRVWIYREGEAFLKPLIYQTAAGVDVQFTPHSVAKELEAFGKLGKP